MLILIPDWFIRYKFFNSLFLGVSVGAIFTLYTPLNPSIYSIGGILLALGMLLVARTYHYILNALWFFRISLFVEIVLLLAIIFFLVSPYNYQTALIMYIGYQITFVFGSYLIRAETLLLRTDSLLTKVDTTKQLGYLIGMGTSYLFYKLLETQGITQNQEQVYQLHFMLFVVEIIVIALIFKSFRKDNE
jgi:putative membrane protein